MMTSLDKMITAGLVFCSFGDIFLEFQEVNEVFFLVGLVAFLIGHIFYILAFKAEGTALPPIPLLVGFFLYWVGILYVLLPSIEADLKVIDMIHVDVI